MRDRVIIEGYKQFGWVNSELGSLRSVLAYEGVVAPHSGKPYSEAMLLGLAGGVSAMYFVFEYEGHEPHIFIGTRNHEDNMGEACKRLGIALDVKETTSRDKAVANLTAALEGGHPAIVWANMYS